MKGIRIKNMRSLEDTGEIELKPINVLVGQNSSGKSTFLRTFPLLKQSFTRKINGPILWCGETDDYVDFGSFVDTLSKNAKENEITIEFIVPYNYLNLIRDERLYGIFSIYGKELNRYDIETDFKLAIVITREDKKDIVSRLEISMNDDVLCIDRMKDIYLLNGKVVLEETKDINKRTIDFENTIVDLISDLDYQYLYQQLEVLLFDEKPNYEIFKSDLYNYLAVNEFLMKKENIAQVITEFEQKLSKKFPIAFEGKIKNEIDIEKIINLSKVMCLEKSAEYGLKYIYDYFKNISYIAPIRAHAERYYREMNLSVNELDAQGKNLAILINSLSKNELLNYQKWTQDNFGFKVNIAEIRGHLSINIGIR